MYCFFLNIVVIFAPLPNRVTQFYVVNVRSQYIKKRKKVSRFGGAILESATGFI